MKIEKTNGIITILSETFQGGDEKTGASQLLNRQEVFVDGEKLEIPVISGNSIRGFMRRLIMEDFLNRINLKLNQMDVFHAFFDGGALQSIGAGGILDLDLRQKIIKYIPPVHLWGFSLGNQQLSSNMQVKQAMLCCQENLFRMPQEHQKYCKYDHYTFIGQQFFTRKDESGNAGLKKDKEDPTIQMKVDMEVFIPGTKFSIGFVLINPSQIEISCLDHALMLWKERGTIGGRASAGLGQIKIDFDHDLDPKIYTQFIEDNKDEIGNVVQEIQKGFTIKKEKSKNKKSSKKKPKKTNDEKGDLDESSK